MPSFNPINFNEEVELPTPKPPIPPYKAPEVPEVPVIPKDIIPKVKEKLECPPPNAPRIGDVAQNQKERVSGFEVQNGVCVTLYEDIPWQAQYLPAPQVVATTGGIAIVATSSVVSKTVGRFTVESNQTNGQSGVIKKDLKDQGEEGKDRVLKGTPRSSARTLTGDTDPTEDGEGQDERVVRWRFYCQPLRLHTPNSKDF